MLEVRYWKLVVGNAIAIYLRLQPSRRVYGRLTVLPSNLREGGRDRKIKKDQHDAEATYFCTTRLNYASAKAIDPLLVLLDK